MRKIFTLSAMALAAVAINAQSVKTLMPTPSLPYSFDGLSISANGQYVCGSANYNQACFIWDTTTGEVTTHEDGTDGGTELRAVTNAGVAYGFGGYEPSYAMSFNTAGQVSRLPMPDGCEALVNGCNPDGSMAVGVVYGSDYTSHACYWQNGVLHMLPEPTTEEAGYEVNGTRAEGVSADGKIILGAIVDNFSTMPVVVWRLDDSGEYVFDNITKDIYIGDEWEAPEGQVKAMQITGTGISANGRWISATCVMSDDENQLMQFGRLDTETGELTTASYRPEDGTNIYSADVADDGTMVGFTYVAPWSWGGGVREPLIWRADEEVKAINTEYCADFFATYSTCNNSATAITPDAKYIQGYIADATTGMDFCWVLDLSEVTALHQVDAAPADAPVEVYNLQGVRVATSTEGLPAGFYIVRQGSTSSKVAIR